MNHIPYLTVNEDLQCEWVSNPDIIISGAHRLTPYSKSTLSLDTNETVKSFIRFNRNYYSIWSTENKTYEKTPTGVVELNLPSVIPPAYDGGWYIGYEGGFVYVVNRKSPEESDPIPVTFNIISMVMVKYTKFLIVTTSESTTRYTLVLEGKKKLTEPKTLCSSAEHMAIDDDGAVFAAAHYGGKITIIWTTSWKTHHTIRSPPIHNMTITKTILVGITQSKAIYVWNLISGEVEICLTSGWCMPDYVFLNEDITPVGITTVSKDNGLIATFGVGEKIQGPKWEIFSISPKCKLISTVKLNYSIHNATMWNTNLVLNADGMFMRFRYSMNQRSFVWPEDIIKWIQTPSEELYLEPLCDTNGSVPAHIASTIITHMQTVIDNLLEAVIGGQKICQWSFNRLLKDEEVRAAFTSCYEYSITKLYAEGAFDDREVTHNIVVHTRLVALELSHLYSVLMLPEKQSDFIFWLALVNVRPKEKLNVANIPHFINTVYEAATESEMPGIRRCAKELLYEMNQYIDIWNTIFKDVFVFEFIDPNIIPKLCSKGHACDIITCLSQVKKKKSTNNNIRNCWKKLVEWVLDLEQLKAYGYPNLNDGIWKRKSVDDIPNNAWVVVDDVVQQWRAGNTTDEDAKIKCWIPNKEGLSNSIERALHILDRDVWGPESDWVAWHGESLIDSGFEVRIRDVGVGKVIEWPLIMLNSGIIMRVAVEDAQDIIFYRAAQYHWLVPPTLRTRTEQYMKRLILDKKLPYLPPSSKSVLFDMLKPSVITSISRMQMLSEFTCMCVESPSTLWFGTYCGDIMVVKAEDMSMKNKEMVELLNTNHETITSMDYGHGYVASASDDAVVQIWYCRTLRVKCVHEGRWTSVKCVRFVSETTVWILTDAGSVFAWNFESDNTPELVQNLRPHTKKIHLGHYSMDCLGKYAIVNTSRIVQWFTKYPYHMNEVRSLNNINVVILYTDYEYIVGDSNGRVMLYSIDEKERSNPSILHEIEDDSIAALKAIVLGVETYLFVGTKSGKFEIKPFSAHHATFEWNLKSEIKCIEYSNPYIFVLTADFTLYTLMFVPNNIKLACESLCALSKIGEWRKFLRFPSKTDAIQEIIIEGARNRICIERFADVINIILQNEDNLKSWCKKKILLLLQVGVLGNSRVEYDKIMDRLFCFSGKKFTCVLCLGSSSSPKRFPISAINTCMHRFHTKCIMKHIRKTAEYDDECRHQWALNVTLKCPTCREPFSRDNIVADKFTAELCKYISDEESSEVEV
jgi:hypothetical protein